MEPACTLPSTACTMPFAFASLRQSCGSIDHSTTRIPNFDAMPITLFEKLPPGGRNSFTVSLACCRAMLASCISLRIRLIGSDLNGGEVGWSQEWLPTSMPAFSSACTSSGCWATSYPMVKNVAGTWNFCRIARIWGVYVGLGPSSKVRATVGGVNVGPVGWNTDASDIMLMRMVWLLCPAVKFTRFDVAT